MATACGVGPVGCSDSPDGNDGDLQTRPLTRGRSETERRGDRVSSDDDGKTPGGPGLRIGMGKMINVAKNSWGKRSGLRAGGPLHKGGRLSVVGIHVLGWYNLQRMYPLLTHVSATNNTCIRIDKCCLLLLIIVRDTSLIIVNVSSLLRLITLTSVRALLKQKSHVRGLNPQPRALMPPGREYCYGVVARSACMPAVSNGRPAMYCLRYNTAERLYPSLVPRYSRTPALAPSPSLFSLFFSELRLRSCFFRGNC